MLDFTNPWGFMEELDNWIGFLYELQKRAGLSIVDLEEMAANSNIKYIHSLKLLQEIQRSLIRWEWQTEVKNNIKLENNSERQNNNSKLTSPYLKEFSLTISECHWLYALINVTCRLLCSGSNPPIKCRLFFIIWGSFVFNVTHTWCRRSSFDLYFD